MSKLLLAAALWVGLVAAGWSLTVEEQLLATLRSQGYVILEQGYTFLGRLRVVAQNGELRREIVVNPGTGEILRDYAVLLPGIAAPGRGTAGDGTASSSPSQGSGNASGVGVTIGAATASGVSEGDGVSSTASGTAGSDTESTGSAGMTDGLVAPEMILTDPVLPFSADGQ